MVAMNNYDDFECDAEEKDGCDCKRCELILKAYNGDNTPWKKLYALAELHAHQKDIPFPNNEKNNIKYSAEPWDEYTFDWESHLRSISDIIEEHTIRDKGKKPRPNLKVLNEDFHQWAFWQVTGGRFIANPDKKNVWVLWNHRKRPITIDNIACLKHNKKDNYMWHKLPETVETLDVYYDIASAAQDLCQEYLKWTWRYLVDVGYTNNTKMSFVMWENCNNMPATVKAFRSCVRKDFTHNQFKWKMGRVSAGGNQGWREPEKPRKLPNIPYVHKMMVNYNKWLERGRRHKTPKQGTISHFLT